MRNDLTQLELYHRQLLQREKFIKAAQIKKKLEQLKKLYSTGMLVKI